MAEHRANAPEHDYDTFVDHPRFGRRPRITGLDPKPFDPGVRLHWHSIAHKEYKAKYGASWTVPDPEDNPRLSAYVARRIPNTAIVADVERQTWQCCDPVTHYFDLAQICSDCKRWFIFFAEEQKYWYEELGFRLESGCIRCVECRKKEQGIAWVRQTYERLSHVTNRDVQQCLEMAEACLVLIEAGHFGPRRTETVRMLFNSIPKDAAVRNEPRFADLQNRLLTAEGRRGPVT